MEKLTDIRYADTMSDPESIGRRIREVRQARGWTQDQLAVAVDVSRSAVAQWETGRAGQLTANLTRIAAVLDVGVEFLMHGSHRQAGEEIRLGDEIALLRLYRECMPEDRQMVLRLLRRMAATAEKLAPPEGEAPVVRKRRRRRRANPSGESTGSVGTDAVPEPVGDAEP